jgi:hypothetical protein
MIPSATSGGIDAVLDRDDDEVDDIPGDRYADGARVPDTPEASDGGVDGETAIVNRSDDTPPEAILNGRPGTNARAHDNVSRDRDSLIVGDPMAAADPRAIGNADDMPDPTGITQLYKLDRDIDRKIERYKRDGKDPHDLFDPSKADYLGTPEALAPYTGRGLLWLASNTGGDSPGRKIPTPPAQANSSTDQANVAPTEAVAGPRDPDLSEPAAAEDARVKAAEVLARRMRAGGNPDSNLLPLTLLLALPFAPEIAPAILGADAAGTALGARTIAALRTAWPKIKDAVAQLPGFGRSGSNQSGLSFDEFLKEIQTKHNVPTNGGDPAIALQDPDFDGRLIQSKETERPTPQDDQRPDQIKDLLTPIPGSEAAEPVSKDYRKTFILANPGLDGKVWVHHAIPQVVLQKYPGVMSAAETHELDNLRGIPNGINRDLHLKELATEWNKFYRENRTATKELLRKKAMDLDVRYGHLFLPAR